MVRRIITLIFCLLFITNLNSLSKKNEDGYGLFRNISIYRTDISEKKITCYLFIIERNACTLRLPMIYGDMTAQPYDFTFYIDGLNIYVYGCSYVVCKDWYVKPSDIRYLIPMKWYKYDSQGKPIELTTPPISLLLNHGVKFPSILKIGKLKLFDKTVKKNDPFHTYYRILEYKWADFPIYSFQWNFQGD